MFFLQTVGKLVYSTLGCDRALRDCMSGNTLTCCFVIPMLLASPSVYQENGTKVPNLLIFLFFDLKHTYMPFLLRRPFERQTSKAFNNSAETV